MAVISSQVSGRFVEAKKKAGRVICLPGSKKKRSDVRLGLAEALNAVARFPLAALFKQIEALETLQDVALDDDTAGTLEAFVLRHVFIKVIVTC